MTNYMAALVDELYQLGVREVVISPGSRSTPLAMLFCEHAFKTFLNIDERSAGFFALGIAKGCGRPAVLVCTSGSAPAHYLPALTEARHSRVPLIVLTADRPPELRQVGAPQTIDQNRLFGGFVKYYEELALPEEQESMYRYVRVVMQRAYASAVSGEYGAAHINIPVREPLIPDLSRLNFAAGRGRDNFKYVAGTMQPAFDPAILKDKQGIIICGGGAGADYHQAVLDLGKRLQAPVLADPLSNLRNYAEDIIIDSYDAFLQSDTVKMALKPDFIFHFGQVPVSKRLQQFVARHQDVLYFQVDESFAYRNPALSTTSYISASPKLLAASITMHNNNAGYAAKWLTLQQQTRNRLNRARDEKQLFEGKLIQLLQELLPPGTLLAVANSMAIRDVDYFFAARRQNIKVMCNRGTNGIDGTVSTALGMAAIHSPTVLLTGDVAFYHDLNGLLTGKTHALNLLIVLFNNNGGGIFNYLPQRAEKHFDYLFRTPHDINFRGLQTLYGITYYEATGYPAFEQAFQEALTLKGIKLIEVKIDAAVSKALHDQYTTGLVTTCS
ncbi:2-succinyl-5-enolpyruvyl-6-hydroxy-3-cyclohexene-1-carboxylic-acid synthase [Sporomusa termitida]|uniref:2-succinyl-5-enolpyruvyl-6-hydroxy-3-cyclohexene-1-carboxylate synthase n=1 Tax=Sporomusa termitida TaxID=2377 RepID=A0A517DRJ2_9FIRM|nr:2-succinyl-5-enolpyruvyl-6-hydroxy-3-cyclohexene-1-carboxylic-acid synthase [Sporomusa termitida]QDR79906.1 2-succinyl-5-enolpyruvyl-6-hydroxy-3-cyclohexene-1-carboxylate synthase [Sporomusa termitida]